jgi:DNA integrity scanning protein DisA with diadenylate cyclase activity
MFTFYLCQEDGASGSFEAFELMDESGLRQRAAEMLAGHASASYVNVWNADRKVLTLHRHELAESAREMAFSRDQDRPS